MEKLMFIIESHVKTERVTMDEATDALLSIAIGCLPHDPVESVSKMMEATQAAAWLNGRKFEISFVGDTVEVKH